MEISIAGEGEVVVRFIDATGQTLLQERLTISGSPTMRGLRNIDLEIDTVKGRVAVAPVLVHQSNARQRVTFDGSRPALFTRDRCKEIGCTPRVVKDAAMGRAVSPGPSVSLGAEDAMTRLIDSITPGEKPK